MANARAWGVEQRVLGVQVDLPDTRFAGASFDAIYTSTTMEMIRGAQGEAAYRTCLGELFRLLRPGGRLALGEPMHFDVSVPPDLAPLLPEGDPSWEKCFSTVERTVESVESQGFGILEADYAPDAHGWWLEVAAFDPGCQANPLEEPRAITVDGGRWLSFGYVSAQKPV